MKQRYFIALLLLIFLLQIAVQAWIGVKWYHNDEHTYLSEGWLFTKGKLPLLDYHEIRPPLLEVITGVFFSFFGSSIESGRALVLLAQLCTITLVALFARRLMSDCAALLASFLYVLMVPAFAGFQLLADPFLALFGILAAAISWKAVSPGVRYNDFWWLAAGFAAGLAAAMRQSGAWQVAAIITIAVLACKKGSKAQGATLALLGAAAPFSLLAAYYWIQGGLIQFLHGVFLGPAKLASDFAASKYLFSFNEAYLFFFIPLIAYFYLLRTETGKIRRSTLLILGMTGAAGIMAFFPNRAFFHLAPALPQLAIAFSLLIRKDPLAMLRKPVLALLYLIALGGIMFFLSMSWLFAVSDGSISGNYFYTEFNTQEMYQLWRNIGSNSTESDTMLAFPHVQPYLVAERMPASYYMASGFWYLPEEMNTVKAALLSDLKTNKPLFIVYMNYSGYSLRSYAPGADAYVWENYKETERFEANGVFNMSILRRAEPA